MSKDLKEALDKYRSMLINDDQHPSDHVFLEGVDAGFYAGFYAGFNAAKKPKKNIFNLVRWGDHKHILIYAFRYAICRASSSKDTMQDALIAAWPELSQHDRRHIKREIKEHHDDIEVDSLEKRGHVQGDFPGWKALLELED